MARACKVAGLGFACWGFAYLEFGLPQPSEAQLSDMAEPGGSDTFFFLQLVSAALVTATVWPPGETTKVKGVDWPMT
jgi:hypothetical protein